MNTDLSRRKLFQAAGAAALAPRLGPAADIPGPRVEGLVEGKDTPKICLEMGTGTLAAGGLDEAGMRKIKQLGVNHVLSGGPRIPWEESRLKELMDRLKGGGLTLGNLMIGGFNNTIYGKPGRDEEIEKVNQSIRAAGRVGLPVIEYNFYAHRAMEVPGPSSLAYAWRCIRTAGPAQPWIGTDHGDRRGVEAAYRNREKPFQRDYV